MEATELQEVDRMADARSRYQGFVLLLLAAGCWAISAVRMSGMDAGPGGDLGGTGWFMATWATMMAAMMLPVVAPLAGRYRQVGRPLAAPGGRTATFLGGYLAVWAIVGLLAYELISSARRVLGDAFAWGHGGRWVAVALLAAAAGYQLTGRKREALERCKQASDLGGRPWLAGLTAGVNCLRSSWAMMAALFALGVMSVWWMAVVAVLIAAERLPPPSAHSRFAGASVFLALALGVAISPPSVPGLTVPGSPAASRAMMHMSSGHAGMSKHD